MSVLATKLKLQRYPSRKSVADAALCAQQPFSMKQLLLHLKRTHAVTSKATAYRTVTLLVENELLREPFLFEGEWIYFPATRKNEMLWICTDCRKASLLPSSPVNYFLREYAAQHGLQPETLMVHVKYTCLNRDDCKKHQSGNDGVSRIWPD
ncbi:MAG: transcriptional repressor [Chthoniobacterales bacterium]